MNRRNFIKSLSSATVATSLFPSSAAHASGAAAALAVLGAVVQVARLFTPSSNLTGALAAANHQILTAIHKQLSDIQGELTNITRDLKSILDRLEDLPIAIDSKIRENRMIELSASIAESHQRIAENRERYGPDVNVDTYIEQIKGFYTEFVTLRNGLFGLPIQNLQAYSIHLCAAMINEVGTIAFFNNLDWSNVRRNDLLDYVTRDWSIELDGVIRGYLEKYRLLWHTSSGGILRDYAEKLDSQIPDFMGHFFEPTGYVVGSDGSGEYGRFSSCRQVVESKLIHHEGRGATPPKTIKTYFGKTEVVYGIVRAEVDPAVLPGRDIPKLETYGPFYEDYGEVGWYEPGFGVRITESSRIWKDCRSKMSGQTYLDLQSESFEKFRIMRLEQFALWEVGQLIQRCTFEARDMRRGLRR